MKKEIWDNKLDLLNTGTINNPLCTYQLPVLTGKDCEGDSNDIYVNSFLCLFNIESNRCITPYLSENNPYDYMGLYYGSLWNTDCALPDKWIKGRLIQLSYSTNYINNTRPTLIPASQNKRVGQLPIFMYTNISSSSEDKIIGAVVFVVVRETWQPYNQITTEGREYYKLLFTTWKGDSNGFYHNSNLAISAIYFESANARNNTYTNDRLISAGCELRILYSWYVNAPSSDNIVFWTHSGAYIYCDEARITPTNADFTNYSNSTGGYFVMSDDHIVYENYTLPWDHSSANLMLSVGIYFGNVNNDPNFYEFL